MSECGCSIILIDVIRYMDGHEDIYDIDYCPKHAAVDDYIKEIEHLKRFTWCAYCGFEINLDDNAASQIKKHIHTCELHPLTKVTKQRDDLLAVLKQVEWIYTFGNEVLKCPQCRRTQREGHADSCNLKATIAKAEGK